jgi:two-component system nitrogen regulation sensor histidine kinase NtrY
LIRWAGRVGLGRRLAVALAILALGSGVATYAALTGSLPFGRDAGTILILLNIDLILFLMLFAVVARQLVTVWMERRRGSVGSRLHSRLVFWFSLVALTPAVIVSVFSAVFFSFGMQAWFSDSVRTAVAESQLVAEAYLREHQRSIRGDILAMARDLSRASPRLLGSTGQLSRVETQLRA